MSGHEARGCRTIFHAVNREQSKNEEEEDDTIFLRKMTKRSPFIYKNSEFSFWTSWQCVSRVHQHERQRRVWAWTEVWDLALQIISTQLKRDPTGPWFPLSIWITWRNETNKVFNYLLINYIRKKGFFYCQTKNKSCESTRLKVRHVADVG